MIARARTFQVVTNGTRSIIQGRIKPGPHGHGPGSDSKHGQNPMSNIALSAIKTELMDDSLSSELHLMLN